MSETTSTTTDDEAAPVPAEAKAGLGRMTCPVCRAAQEWSDTCRRCKCDLSFLRRAAETARRHRLRCLRHLSAGNAASAQRSAQHAWQLCPDSRSAQLLAVCRFACHDFSAAMRLASRFDDTDA